MKFNLLLLLALCILGVGPVSCISRWFTSSYYDLRVSLHRFSYCVGDLPPLKDHNLNETEFLAHQMKMFLDQANYDNEQLANVTALMDTICHTDTDFNYPISVNIDINKYSNMTGKENRCKAIDEVLEAMYPVLKRASLNRSEPLDFNSIQFYANASDKSTTYSVVDLINTSWIKSDTPLDVVCSLTGSVKSYVMSRAGNYTVQKRAEPAPARGAVNALLDLIDRLLDPILGLQKRLYWESNNRFEQVFSGLAYQLSNIRGGVGKGYNQTKKALTSVVGGSAANSTATKVASSSNLPGNRTTEVSTNSQNGTMMIPSKTVSNTTTAGTSTTSKPMN